MTENLKLQSWGNHNYRGSKPKSEDEIKTFEDGERLECCTPPMSCRTFPDSCTCRQIEARKRNDGKTCAILYLPEPRTSNGKPFALDQMYLDYPELKRKVPKVTHRYSERSEAYRSVHGV